MKVYLIHFLFRHEFEFFLRESWTNQFSLSWFRGCWNCDLRTDLFNRFLQKSSPFVQKTTCVTLSKENLFCSNNAHENHIFNSLRHQKRWHQDSTFFYLILTMKTVISKLVSPLKLLPSLIELKDNNSIIMSTINKKFPEMWRNRSFLINEVEKIVRFFFTFTSHQMPKVTVSFLPWSAKNQTSGQLCETTWGNNRLYALMLVHVHINIVDNINLADIANQFVDRKDSRKQTFGHLSQNYICENKLTLRYFSYIYICLYFLSNIWNVELCNVISFIK